jgi:hypothetical protein
MDYQTKAATLQQHLNYPEWLTTIGLGEAEGRPCLFVYVNNMSLARKADIPPGWQGIPVNIKYMGTIHPARA